MQSGVTKSGVKTTEFWMALIAQGIPVLVILGVLTPGEGEALVLTIGDAIVAAVAVIASLAPILAYIKSRAEVKVANGRK